MAEPGSPLSRQAIRRLVAALLMPALVVAGWLIAEGADALPIWLHGAVLDLPLPPVVIWAAFTMFVTSRFADDARLRSTGLLVLCSTAPLALLYPWAVAPGPLPGGFGGLSYFLGWLTRYPNVGPINIEVLAGIAALLATGFLPAVVGALAVMGAPRRTILATAALAVLAYLPVLIRLDIELALVTERLRDAYDLPAYPYFGPIMRAVATIAMLVLAAGPAVDLSRPPAGSRPAHR